MTVEAALATWLPGQRWYGGKGRAVRSVELVSRVPLLDGVDHVVAEVATDDGERDHYQLLLGRRAELPAELEHARVGEVGGDVVYDATHDPTATAELLRRFAERDASGPLRFSAVAALDPALPGRVMGAEQSNTSLVFGDVAICKLFRRLQPGTNPDLEVSLALARSGSAHVAEPLAWLEGEVAGEVTTLALVQRFLKGASEGWAMATASVRDLFAEGDLHADEVGGDFAGEAERLGAATAEVHRLMAQSLPTSVAGPAESEATARQLRERLDAALLVAPELAPWADDLRSAYDEVGRRTDPVAVQRVHGDLHLGQVLRTQEGWVLLDFEGEPARPLAERTALMSPLRDVAGMLRSFDYAARHLLADQESAERERPHLAYRAQEWAERNRGAFCDGYAREAGSDPRDEQVLLRAFELDKAVYEVVYETRNRPTWVQVPLASIERLVGARA